MLRRLLLLPLLSPLVAATVVGALNPTPVLSLRLLTWSSPALPLGAWITGAALGGAVLSGAGASLALRPPAAALRRRVRLERVAARDDERDGEARDGDGDVCLGIRDEDVLGDEAAEGVVARRAE